jgi:hypothetical protein
MIAHVTKFKQRHVTKFKQRQVDNICHKQWQMVLYVVSHAMDGLCQKRVSYCNNRNTIIFMITS